MYRWAYCICKILHPQIFPSAFPGVISTGLTFVFKKPYDNLVRVPREPLHHTPFQLPWMHTQLMRTSQTVTICTVCIRWDEPIHQLCHNYLVWHIDVSWVLQEQFSCLSMAILGSNDQWRETLLYEEINKYMSKPCYNRIHHMYM